MAIDYNADIAKRKAELARLDKMLNERATRAFCPNKSVDSAKLELATKRTQLSQIKAAIRRDSQTRQNIASQAMSIAANIATLTSTVKGLDGEIIKEQSTNGFTSLAHLNQLRQWRERDAGMLVYWQEKHAAIKDAIVRQTMQRCLSQTALNDLRRQAAALQSAISGLVAFLESVAIRHDAIDAIDALEISTALLKEAHRSEVIASRKDAKKQADFLKWLERKRIKEAATH